jgi:acyl carrier protein phosphodiesterase
MNYLAHSFLAGKQAGLQVGNFIADHIHGSNFSYLPEEIISGVKCHRRIDTFTDEHAKFRECKRLFYDGFERYSGILIDIYFDHLLAKNFSRYSAVPLETYCQKTYSVYQEHLQYFPAASKQFLHYVVCNNIFMAYASQEGIESVLFHMSQRINHGVFLNKSLPLFIKNETRLEENFEIFFEEAIATFL